MTIQQEPVVAGLLPRGAMAPGPPQQPERALLEGLMARLAQSTHDQVVLHETHISWVMLAGSLAYKLKKPVRLPFLDFSSVEARRRFCEEELHLNRRLAPELYLDVLPVCGTPHAPRLGGPGVPIDHVLCMRRFAAGALLSERLSSGALGSALLGTLARRLAAFHRVASAQPPRPGAGSPEQVKRAVLDVLDQLEARHGQAVMAPLRAWVEAQSASLQSVFAQRLENAAVRDCHGDLHLANTVALDNEATAFDCIEFDPVLRFTDVMADVGFLTMDLKAHGRDDLAWGFLDDYLADSGDHEGLRVLRFYEVYRALVRALVAGLSPKQSGAPDYLACARRLIDETGLRKPCLLITHGLSGSGKSTLARELLQAAGAVRLRSDVERKRLFGLAPLEHSERHGLDIYTPAATQRTFAALASRARIALQAGYPVIVDATFLRRAERARFEALAAELGLPLTILECRADDALLRQRVGRRAADASEATLDVLQRQKTQLEPLEPQERERTISVDSAAAVDIAELASRWSGRRL
jgi:aminoglycoside phosphotransferase family enzyme/predicted kinase